MEINCIEHGISYVDGCKTCGKPQHGIKSDGGSTSYYELPEHATELKHLISARGMSFARGNVFKACYRLGEKDGASVEYDLKKMLFFVQDMIDAHNRGERV